MTDFYLIIKPYHDTDLNILLKGSIEGEFKREEFIDEITRCFARKLQFNMIKTEEDMKELYNMKIEDCIAEIGRKFNMKWQYDYDSIDLYEEFTNKNTDMYKELRNELNDNK